MGSICLVMVLGVGVACSQPSASAVDSFCVSYHRVIASPGDAAKVSATGPIMKRNIAANELLYRCTCPPVTLNGDICKQFLNPNG